MLKILHVISSVNPKNGGPIEGIRQLNSPMRKLGVSVDIVCCDDPDAPWLVNLGITSTIPLGGVIGKYAYSAKLLKWLRANGSSYDAIIVNGLWQYSGFAVRKALKDKKIPYFVFTHGMLDPWFKKNYPLKHLKKWLYWTWGEYLVLRDAKAVIFTCEDERVLARQSFWLYRVNEVVTSYGTASPPMEIENLKEMFFLKYQKLQGMRLILFLSRIQEKKGCDILIEAFSKIAFKHNNLHLVMAGPDQDGWITTLQAMIVKLGISDRISWLGMLQGDMKWGAFYAAEVFCLPSHQENFGIVVAEALACGKPVLISNKVNIWREIEMDAAGFIDEDTVDGTVRNLERWLALSPEDYSAMVSRAICTFRFRFHIDRAAHRLLEIIKDSIK